MEMKSRVIESRRNNVLKDTTGTTTLETQKIQYLQDWLVKLSDVMLYIHKLQLQTKIDKENYDLLNLDKHGIAKVHKEKIGQTNAPHNVEYQLHTNGTIMIFVSCSENPFRLYEEQDISKIMLFLGRVEDRLKILLSDNRDKVVPSVMDWILKCCDVNKDIEIDEMAELTLHGVQISMAEKAFRAYVKVIADKAYYRAEKSLTPNEPMVQALENIRTNTDLTKDFQFLEGEDSNRETDL